jgi:hypothetical protein
MRKFFFGLLLVCALLAAVGIGAAMAVHWVGFAKDANVSIDGVTLDEAGVGAIVGLAAACIAIFGVLIALVVIASVAVVLPLALIIGVAALAFAMVIGLSPLLVPVLLIVGVVMLVSRRSKRRAQALPAMPSQVPPASTAS